MTCTRAPAREAKLLGDPAWRIGLGTYRLGDATYAACAEALGLGYRHFDTASLYRNEAAVAKAVREAGIERDRVFVTSKISIYDIERRRVREAALASVERLERIDLLLLHGPTRDCALAWEQLLRVVEAGEAVGAVGVSNFDVHHLDSLDGLPVPAVNQIEVTPFLQRRTLIERCRRDGIAVVAHSPLTKGRKLEHPALESVVDEIGATATQIMLAWALDQDFVAIPRSANPKHLRENLAAASLVLPMNALERLATLEEGFATHPQHLDPSPVGSARHRHGENLRR